VVTSRPDLVRVDGDVAHLRINGTPGATPDRIYLLLHLSEMVLYVDTFARLLG
jgi:hypothetical protein